MDLTISDVKAAVEKLKIDTSEALKRVADDVKALQDIIAAGDRISQADLQSVIEGISAVDAQLKGTDPVPGN